MVPKGKLGSKTQRHGGRVVLSLDVEPHVREALRERAEAAGVSMAEYFRNAIAEPERLYATNPAQIARPLAIVSYHVSRALIAVEGNDLSYALDELRVARGAIAGALRPLERAHAEEIQSLDRRRAGGWKG